MAKPSAQGTFDPIQPLGNLRPLRWRAAAGVEGVSSEVLGADRFVDPLTVGAIIVTVTVVVKETTSLIDALNDLVESVKRLGATLGVKAWMENRRKRVDIDPNANSRAVAETAAANVQSSAQIT